MPRKGDVLIRSIPSRGEQSRFVLLDAMSEQVIIGPVRLEEVVLLVHELRNDGAEVWQQFADERGRPTGPVMRFRADEWGASIQPSA